eukprot:CAMPEP_0115127172 /NCGR_PEP_ID=MMETSP0227-20121206/50214_1 /TAXON_ID=89957 /ORGANISM="Polarella glacialis, Strain CCMP 1383" /LENGTH=48 /DNA_ID= /DNA_START= /DNA_END= /DNA_ORIENTATION=
MADQATLAMVPASCSRIGKLVDLRSSTNEEDVTVSSVAHGVKNCTIRT